MKALSLLALILLGFQSAALADYTYENVPAGYGLAWSDEFNGAVGSLPNSANWSYDTGVNQPNSELENYTNSTNNVHVIADPNAVDGKALAIIALDPGGNNDQMGNYTSARIHTEDKKTFTYGYMEARVRMPYGQGIWPAFWMLGNDIGNGVSWPACDEIDIMENIGNSGDQGTNHMSLHDGSDTTFYPALPGGQLYHNAYHTFAALWQPNQIQFFVDGNLMATDTPATLGNNWAFNNNPNFFLLNVAVGGNWPGNPDASTSFPQTMVVDYVRAYQTGFAAPTPVVQPTWRVRCGGDNYTDSQGNVWSSDTNFTGGWPAASTNAITGALPGAGDQSLYQWERYGNTTGGQNLTYTFNVPASSNYQVTLKFAEDYWTAAGKRLFNYAINGTTEATNFDIFAAAGGQFRALDKVYTVSPNANGQIVISLTTGGADNPKIDAIQIIPVATSPTATPTKTNTPVPPTATFTPTFTSTPLTLATWRVRAGGTQLTDSQGNVWSADTNFTGGTVATVTTAITGALPTTADQALYQSERYGNPYTYSFPVPAGNYQVTMKFAETYWTAAGKRVFNASINGATVLTNFDIFAAAGAMNKATDQVFNNIAPANGLITIQMGPASVDNAKVDAIQIIPMPATATFTATKTNTVVNTTTSTNTPVNTATWTATATSTNTSAPPTATGTFTSTLTPVNTNTPTSTNTPAPPTATFTVTNSPTLTNTPVNTATSTNTAVPPTATNTAVPPTATNTAVPPTATNTAVPPTATATKTVTNSPTVTSTNTPVPPTNTPTHTPVPPTATPTSSSKCAGVAAWSPNSVHYAIGAKVTYAGVLYQCIQAHNSLSTWTPPATPALWMNLGNCN